MSFPQVNGAVVFQSDFGRVDGAVAAMYGVAHAVSPELKLFDLTHEIPPFNIREASYRLIQTVAYWAPGTVFVSVVDPGVGTSRTSVVALTKSGHYIITPNNGTLTHLASSVGIVELREIEEAVNRLANSGKSFTFHGRDVYAYTGARLAAGLIDLEGVGRKMSLEETMVIPSSKASFQNDAIEASIDVLDARYGSVWTNCPRDLFLKLGADYGTFVNVGIAHFERTVYGNDLKFVRSFADVNIGAPIVYINSLLHVGIAINQGNFSRAYDVESGDEWKIQFRRAGLR